MPQSKTSPVLSHWYTVLDGFSCSSEDFYRSVEKEIAARKLPGLRVSRVEYLEGGIFSDKRIYLRLARERYAFDVCAAKFGRAFFFSVRLVERKASLIALIALVFGAVVAFGLFLKLLGALWDAFSEHSTAFMGWSLGIVAAIIAGRKIIQNARSTSAPTSGTLIQDGSGVKIVSEENPKRASHDWRGSKPASNAPSGGSDVMAYLCSLPIVGGFIERHGRETYYRYDTRLLYLSLVNEIVRKQVEEVTAAKGVRFIETHEYSPIFGDLYKTSKREQEAKVPEPVAV